LGLDIALGVGGIRGAASLKFLVRNPREKTTLTLAIIASAQANGGTAAFVDAEHALDPVYAEKLGVKVNDLLVSQPDTGEQALESPTCWCAPGRSMWSSSTRSLRSTQGRN